MSKRRKSTREVPPAIPYDDRIYTSGCEACKIRAEQLEVYRQQLTASELKNSQLLDRLMALAGDAAERYQRLRLTEAAGMLSATSDEVIPIPMSEDLDEIDTMYRNLGGSRIQKRA
jgi:hypothetical protein